MYVFIFLFFTSFVSSITVRVRSASGAISRFNFQNSDTVATIGNQLIDTYRIEPDSKLKIGLVESILQDWLKNSTKLTETSIKHGDLITIDNIMKNVRTTPRRSSSQTNPMLSTIGQKSLQIKLSRQKDTTNEIKMNSKINDVLNRLSGVRNGMAVLLGKSKARDASTSNEPQSPSSFTFDVMGAVLVVFSNHSSPSPLLTSSERVDLSRIDALATDLGLEVVGCAVGTRDSKGIGRFWSAAHVQSVVQLGQALRRNPSELVVLSVMEDSPVQDLSPSPSWRRAVPPPSASRGVRVEGYQLSQQAGRLATAGVLIPLIAGRRLRGGRVVSLDALRAARIDEWDRVSLNGSVLLRGEEATVVDAHMFAVSVPVESIVLDERSCVSTNNSSFQSLLGASHFPTDADMRRDPSVANRAHSFLVRLVRNVSTSPLIGLRSVSLSTELGERLRDPHLLLFLSRLLGDRDMRLLCAALACRGPIDLPRSLVMSLEQVALSLSPPADNRSVSDDEDEDEL